VSATTPSRLLFEAAICLLVAEILRREPGRRTLLAALAMVLAAAALDSPTRRIGDGFEYLAMARNLSRLQPPSVSRAEFDAIGQEGRAHGDPTWDQAPVEWLRGRDGRYDFPHFWMFSLAASPFVAIARAVGLHPNAGFTAINLVLLLGAAWLMIRAGAALAAVLLVTTLLWWIDKAHAEIFIVAVTGAALLLRDRAPRMSLLLLAVSAAQMPLWLPVLVLAAAIAVAHHGRRVLGAVIGSAAIAALYPLYYVSRLGITSPLGETVLPYVPSVRAVLTPLVDLNLGIAWFVPALVAVALAGVVAAFRQRAWADLAIVSVGTAVVLVASTQTPNVNHGGTPGMSRYGVWLVGLGLPLVLRGDGVVLARWRTVYAGVVILSVLFAAYMFRPRLGDAGTRPSPTRLAMLVWTRAPALDNPLPEVFAERVGHVDGAAEIPVATDRCEKALVFGVGASVIWPASCAPREAPAACVEYGALCYANHDSWTAAPAQPFMDGVARERAAAVTGR
jgi:hypothetical protein